MLSIDANMVPRVWRIRVWWDTDDYTDSTVQTTDIETAVQYVRDALLIAEIPYLNVEHWAA